MHRVDHQGVDLDVFIVPQAAVRQWCVVGTGVNGTVPGIDHAPAALGAGFAHRRPGVRHGIAGTECVRCLVEPVRRRDGTDPYRLEQDVVAGISAHVQTDVWGRIGVPSKKRLRRNSRRSMPLPSPVSSPAVALPAPGPIPKPWPLKPVAMKKPGKDSA